MYKATIQPDNKELLKLLQTEFRNLETKRFTIITDEQISITANDAVALKTALSAVTKAIEIFEKVEKLEDDN